MSIYKQCQKLDQIRLFVLDMDGTFYLGSRILDGALDFTEWAGRTGKEFVFFTNNSSKAPDDYQRKLAGMGLLIEREKIMTSGDVTISYLKRNYPGKQVYLAGTPELEKSFTQEGILLTEEMPDFVVVGFDTTLTYEKLERICTYIRKGAVFIATHPDINCPTEDGFIPDCGAFCAAITLSTGVEPVYMGKPCAATIEMLIERSGYQKDQIAFVGDRLYTDVAAGVNNGATGILVLTGETKLADVKGSPVQPDGIYESLGALGESLQ